MNVGATAPAQMETASIQANAGTPDGWPNSTEVLNRHRPNVPIFDGYHSGDVWSGFGACCRASCSELRLELTPGQARRRTLNANERRMLKCPKTSICRAGGEQHPELRGSTDVENLQIMALTIASIASKWFRTITINEKQLMQTYGITQKQLVNAKKIIQQHYKARIRQGWAPRPQQLHAAAAREDDMDKAVSNLNDTLAKETHAFSDGRRYGSLLQSHEWHW